MYRSTRGNKYVNASKAIIDGIADDGGLYFVDSLDSSFYEENMKIFLDESIPLDYKQVCFKVFKYFLNDFTDSEIKEVIDNGYNKTNFPKKIISVDMFNNFSFCTLYHGPTFAFKDMALTILPLLMEKALDKVQNKFKSYMLTATSGDTGSASLSGFHNTNISSIVLYPNNGVSNFQEKQMHFFRSNKEFPIAIRGNFDDCQRIVKEAFQILKNDSINLLSSNSINIGRLIPQVVYYFYTYLYLVKNKAVKANQQINFSVPTGNFGNILAGYIAKKLGLPINKMICASNENAVLTDFFRTGVYNKNRCFYKTLSPSMDILVSSNLERLLFMASNNDYCYIRKLMTELNEKGIFKVNDNHDLINNLKDFIAFDVDTNETKEGIKEVYANYDYLIDPHTAVGYYAMKKFNENTYTVVVSTASPFKFTNAYYDMFNVISNDNFQEITNLSKITKLEYDNRIDIYKEVNINKIIINKEEAIEFIKEIVNDKN